MIGAIRNVIQLTILGYVLTWIFRESNLYISLLSVTIMTLNSAIHTRSRIKSKYRGLFLHQLTASSLSIWPLTLIGSSLLSADPWWRPDIFLPITGMLLGNSLNGISVGVDHFTHEIREKKHDVLALISLGATTNEATSSLIQRSLYLAMSPSLNAMVTMGVVSIPGMMTGQLIAGNDPLQASFTQMIIMILAAVGTYCGTYLGMRLARTKLINSQGQLCF